MHNSLVAVELPGDDNSADWGGSSVQPNTGKTQVTRRCLWQATQAREGQTRATWPSPLVRLY